jgi:hypothetical protein
MTSLAITNVSRSLFTHEKTETLFKEILRRSLGNLSQVLSRHKGFFPKNSFNHSVRGSRSLLKIGHVHSSLLHRRTNCLGPPKVLLFGLTETSSHGNLRLVLAHPRSSFGLAESSLLNDYFYNNACTGLRCPVHWANRDIVGLSPGGGPVCPYIVWTERFT